MNYVNQFIFFNIIDTISLQHCLITKRSKFHLHGQYSKSICLIKNKKPTLHYRMCRLFLSLVDQSKKGFSWKLFSIY